MYTMQEAFEKGAKHLIKQGKQSAIDLDSSELARCLYRQDRTATCSVRCVVGAFIPDDLYKASLEHLALDEIIDIFPEIFELANENIVVSKEFWRDFQRLHDKWQTWNSTKELIKTLKIFGTAYSLDTAFLESKNV